MNRVSPVRRGRFANATQTSVQDVRDDGGLEHVAAAITGGMLLASGKRGPRGTVMRVAGAALLGFAVRPLLVRTIRDTGARRRTFSARSSVTIDRPISDVFAFFKDFESFPRVIGALRSVIDYADGRSHWEMYTRSGGVVAWDVVVTKYLPNSVIGWESVRGSPIEMRGVVRFAARGPSSTDVTVEMVYRPAHTGLRDAVYAIARRLSPDRIDDALDSARFYVESLPAPVADEPPMEE